ncbi:MAG: hypothetical protein AB7W16_29495 [Candidatus Obscuribacterales bacterium]
MCRQRKQSGMLAEAVTALAIFIPLILLVIFLSMQAGYAYVIARNMSQASEMAARALAEEYSSNSKIATDTDAQNAIFFNIRIPGLLSSNEQFSIPENGWQTATEPKTVTVVATYLPGVGSPPNAPFPNPNLLNLDEAFRIRMASTYRLVERNAAGAASGGSGGGNSNGNSNGNGNGNGNGNDNGNGKGGGKK